LENIDIHGALKGKAKERKTPEKDEKRKLNFPPYSKVMSTSFQVMRNTLVQYCWC
jgi:hypothetical protein